MTLNDCQKTARRHLPYLSRLCWAKRQAALQERDAAGAEKKRWQLVIIILDEDIKNLERVITEQMAVLRFKTKGEVS